ncbi:MAG TPA: cytochrome c peroxidase [Gemmataceae bacterium]|jgi:cytochrome c peroxidase
MRLLRTASPALLLAVFLGGCQPAERYESPRSANITPRRTQNPPDSPTKAESEPLDPEIQWIDIFKPPKPDVLIDFVHAEKVPEEWAKLPKFWNAPALTTPGQAAAVIGLPPLTAGAVAGSSSNVIRIKVPLGLPDPREYVPAGDPLTLGKWKLGQRLFFDDSWLEAKAGTACATCHRPDHGFADREHFHRDSFNTPTLVNAVFNRWQFWDGRAGRLEEVVQRTLEDERESNTPTPFRHTWSGVIGRLRNKPPYHEQFNEVFGKPTREKEGKEQANITQDTVGRALACYLRTILAGDSIHDRAVEQARKKSSDLKTEHYEAVLDEGALKELGREKAKKADVAAELMRGYLLFSGGDKTRPLMNCSKCHSGRTFTDNEFHNLGVGYPSDPGKEGGRFAWVPIGQKNRYLIDAYKTPTLRNLPRTGPYFHDGSRNHLRDVVEFYNLGAKPNNHLDPELRKEDGTRLLHLDKAEIDAVVLFLNALAGGDVDPILKPPASSAK